MPVPKVKLALSEGRMQLVGFESSRAVDEWGWDEFEVANGVTDSSILPPNITTIDVLYIASDQAVTYEHNGADTTITLDAGGFALFFGTSMTALTITNASGNTANIQLGWFGT